MKADDIRFSTAKNICQWAQWQQLFVGVWWTVMSLVCDKCTDSVNTENLRQFKGVWDVDWQRTFLFCFMMKTHFSVMLDIFSQLWPAEGSQTRGPGAMCGSRHPYLQTCWGIVCVCSVTESNTHVHTYALNTNTVLPHVCTDRQDQCVYLVDQWKASVS